MEKRDRGLRYGVFRGLPANRIGPFRVSQFRLILQPLGPFPFPHFHPGSSLICASYASYASYANYASHASYASHANCPSP